MSVKEEDIKVISEHWDQASVTFDADHDTEDLELWKKSIEEILGLKGAGRVLDVR